MPPTNAANAGFTANLARRACVLLRDFVNGIIKPRNHRPDLKFFFTEDTIGTNDLPRIISARFVFPCRPDVAAKRIANPIDARLSHVFPFTIKKPSGSFEHQLWGGGTGRPEGQIRGFVSQVSSYFFENCLSSFFLSIHLNNRCKGCRLPIQRVVFTSFPT